MEQNDRMALVAGFVAQQRNQGLDAAAGLAADLEIARSQLADLEAKLATLTQENAANRAEIDGLMARLAVEAATGAT